jgi:hypothetical protein
MQTARPTILSLVESNGANALGCHLDGVELENKKRHDIVLQEQAHAVRHQCAFTAEAPLLTMYPMLQKEKSADRHARACHFVICRKETMKLLVGHLARLC